MPNHCDNDLTIKGDLETLRAFQEVARGPGGATRDGGNEELLSAHRFIPVPDNFWLNDYHCPKCHHAQPHNPDIFFPHIFFPHCPECGTIMKDAYNRGGYDWCVEHWGTKWGVYDVTLVDEGDDYLVYNFMTAWSPPKPVIAGMGKRFPSLDFVLEYYEGLWGFQGVYHMAKGEVCLDISSDYTGNRGG